MKAIIILIIWSFSIYSSAQSMPGQGSTRAVIIGISDYQDEAIPDLQFAHKDAEAFAQYLWSSAGGGIKEENIKLLINDQATMAAVAAELDWLVEVSEEGDQAIIYFSGHGDVEAKTARQPGFLLTYDSPPKIYIAGAYPLFYLQLIIETLSSDKNVQTLVITDACRAGKLAGSEIGGTQATAANLAKQYANEIKILSCQPDEFSLEGEQWGGGRGVFSYHLIEGLIGMADKNENYQVNLLELENYLESTVPDEAAPQSQIPMTLGSKGTKVAYVDEAVLAELKSLKERELPTLAAIETKGIEESLLAGVDSLLEQKYEDFIAALESDNLLDAQNGKPSADQLYRELIKEESLADLHRLMTRQLATALQDDAQQAINAYLLTNPTEMQKRWEGDTSYAQYPRYLRRAAELLGEKHYMYKYLTAKQFYFEGLNLRLQLDEGATNGSYNEAIKKLEAALKLEDRAAYFYNELGVLFTRLRQHEKAVDNYQQAIDLAPEWGLPYVNLCLEYFYNNEQEKAIEIGDKAIELMPNYPQLYNLVGWVNANYGGKYSDRRGSERRGVELKEDFAYGYLQTETRREKTIKLQRSIELLTKAIEIDSNYATAHSNLGPVYRQTGQIDKAEFHLKKATQLDPTNSYAFWVLGSVYRIQKKCPESEIAYQRSIELKMPNDPEGAATVYTSLGRLYRICYLDDDKALSTFQKALELAPEHGSTHRACSEIYASRNDFQKAEWHMLQYFNSYTSSPKAYESLGSFYLSLNRYEDAERIYLKALELLPDYKEVMRNLVFLLMRTNQYEKAKVWAEILAASEQNNPINLVYLEIIYFKLNNTIKAKKYANKVDQLANEKWRDLNNIAYQYLYLKKFERADYYFKKTRAIDPGNPFNDWNRCCYYSIKGEPKKAIQAFSSALEKGYQDLYHIHTDRDAIKMRAEPEFPVLMEKYFPGQVYEGKTVISKSSEPVYYFENCLLLAKYYEKQGEQERANFLYEKALNLKPDTLTAAIQMDIAEICLNLNKYQQALEVCPDSIHSDDAFTNFDYAKIYYKLNRPEKAEEHFQRFTQLRDNFYRFQRVAVFYYLNSEQVLMEKYVAKTEALYPDNPGPYIGRGLMHASLGNYEAAMQALEKGIEKLPDEINLKLVKAFIIATYKPSEKSKAFKALESIYPDAAKIETCIDLMNTNKFEEASLARKELSEVYAETIIPALLDKPYVRMLVAQKDFNTAMDLIETNNFVLFPYHVLVDDPALAALRETERFKTYLWKNYPGKAKQ